MTSPFRKSAKPPEKATRKPWPFDTAAPVYPAKLLVEDPDTTQLLKDAAWRNTWSNRAQVVMFGLILSGLITFIVFLVSYHSVEDERARADCRSRGGHPEDVHGTRDGLLLSPWVCITPQERIDP